MADPFSKIQNIRSRWLNQPTTKYKLKLSEKWHKNGNDIIWLFSNGDLMPAHIGDGERDDEEIGRCLYPNAPPNTIWH